MVPAAPIGGGNPADSELLPLPDELPSDVERPFPPDRDREAKGFKHLITYFIAVAANTNPTMHYNFFHIRPRPPREEADAALEDAGAGPSPAGVQERQPEPDPAGRPEYSPPP